MELCVLSSMSNKSKTKIEYGDWQTPSELSALVCSLLHNQLNPSTIIEPTCGVGTFIKSSLNTFSKVQKVLGTEINPEYIRIARDACPKLNSETEFKFLNADFFTLDWHDLLNNCPEPILVIGNPPWVTNSQLSSLGSSNLPRKTNLNAHSGIEALTGKSNFDISEAILIKILDWMNEKKLLIAMLCKTIVARKLLARAWKHSTPLVNACLYRIDADKYFGAAVDACLFVVSNYGGNAESKCRVYRNLDENAFDHEIGFDKGRLVADFDLYQKSSFLLSGRKQQLWRSGVKHDCSKVMELELDENTGLYRNGLGETLDIESDLIFPLLKSSDLANGPPYHQNRAMIVTQTHVGDCTNFIRHSVPKTWNYLSKHAGLFEKRASSVYKTSAPFSIFGVGDYTFKPWKVAISGFYKSLNFRTLGPVNNKPVVFDDTCYFIGCDTQDEASALFGALNSQLAKNLLLSLIFWDMKRPITTDVLNSIDINILMKHLAIPTIRQVRTKEEFLFA
jgi:hypothetical protein